jgi:hypothetical protein
MSDSIAQQLAELPQLKRLALQERWKKLFCFDPSSEMRRDFMIPILAYRIQEQAFGSLSPQTEKRLRELARKIECSPTRPITDRQALKPGTRLVRQWGNHVHLVDVEAEGFEYKGSRYRSLSEIAFVITGTKWSGPLFFGLKGKKNAWGGRHET